MLSKFEEKDLPKYDPGSDSIYYGSKEYIESIQSLESNKLKYAQDLIDAYGVKSTAEEVSYLPTTVIKKDQSGQFYGETLDPKGAARPSGLGSVISDFITSPSPDDNIIVPRGIKDRGLKKFKGADFYKINKASSPADEKGSFLVVEAYKDLKDKIPEKIGTYTMYMNHPSQKDAVADAYLKDGKFLEAGKWRYPEIEQQVQSNIKGGGVNNFSVDTSPSDGFEAVRNDDGTYALFTYEIRNGSKFIIDKYPTSLPKNKLSHTIYKTIFSQ